MAAARITQPGGLRDEDEWCKESEKAVLMRSAELSLPSLSGASTGENKEIASSEVWRA